ncbi:unnamed protein product [[Candida] boidinii]|uniref:Unnamed protein product n=1 Tax=Candida boidinii TaxID=5477 RepID=A0ACB5U383_CANBO|nr:unnamed protein product [[Candida] boidinii]GMF00672.1 unnamed protein product [[Candida] boidinii]
MTQEEQEMSPQEFADAFKKLNEAEQAAANMEKMLDSLEGKMEDILKKAEEIGHSEESSFSAADENK